MVYRIKVLIDDHLDPLYEAVIECTEEAILNALCMAEDMCGVNANLCPALPLHEIRRCVELLGELSAPNASRKASDGRRKRGQSGVGGG